MNIQLLPEEIAKDVEDQSLDILGMIKDRIVVIGGWAARAILGPSHRRYTLDVDGFAEPDHLRDIYDLLEKEGFISKEADWGLEFDRGYRPAHEIISRIKTSKEQRDMIKEVLIKIDISGPRMDEKETPHFFEFDMDAVTSKDLNYHRDGRSIPITVPTLEWMTANKLGLPASYKNTFDGFMMLLQADVGEVIDIINKTDNWSEMVLRRLVKSRSRAFQQGNVAHTLLQDAKIDTFELKRRIKTLVQDLSKRVKTG